MLDEPTSSKRLKTETAAEAHERLYIQFHNDLMSNQEPIEKMKPNEIEFLCSSIRGRASIIEAANKKRWKFIVSLITSDVILSIQDEKTGKNLSDIAYEQNNVKTLATILNADGPYPTTKNEKGEVVPVDEKVLMKKKLLKAAVKNRIDLHEYIKNHNMEMVEKFVQDHPKWKHAYNAGNRSALSTALKCKCFNIYSWLRSKGFKTGIDPHFDKHMEELNERERIKVKDSNRKYLKSLKKSYISRLICKSLQLGIEDPKNSEKIKWFYKTLDENPKLQPILQIVSESDEAEIVFDFENKDISLIDPCADKNTFGQTYASGYIYIGAGREKFKVLGTVIHEFMHLAMTLVYGNNCCPFNVEDSTKRDEFMKLVQQYDNDEMKSKSNVIAGAFQKKYDIDRKIAELIVRPAHLMAELREKPKEFKKVSAIFKTLFDCFETEISVIASYMPTLKKQKQIKSFSLRLGCFEQYKESKIYCKKDKIVFQDLGGRTLIRSETPELVATNLVKHLEEITNRIDSKYLFTELKELLNKRSDVQFRELLSSGFMPTLVIVASAKNEFEVKSLVSISNKYETKCNMIFIANIDDPQNSSFTSVQPMNYTWIDLQESSQIKILNTNFKFHNSHTTLNQIMLAGDNEYVNAKIVTEPLVNILNLLQTGIDEELPEPSNKMLTFSIKREFNSKTRGRPKILSTVASNLTKEKLVIIADVAGMGKSTSAKEIAVLLKEKTSNWIAFIDLKDHDKKYKKDNETFAVDYFNANFFSEHILKLKPELKFVFDWMYNGSKNVTFIVDGFDEISPNYKKFVLGLLATIKLSGNRLLVTTREHLCAELEKHLGVNAMKLMPFKDHNFVDFIAKFWDTDKTCEAALRLQAKKMLDKMKKSLKGKSKRSTFSEFFGIPMHVYILAVQTMDQKDNIETFNFNLYDLYRNFVSEKFKYCENKKGQLANKDRGKL